LPLILRPAALIVEATSYYDLQAEDEWASLMPTGHGFGFVRLGAKSRPYEPAIYHQLHCLSGLRRLFTYDSFNNPQDHALRHVHHCLNYLRQSVLCNADTTLEPAYIYRLPDNTSTFAASGMGSIHTCVDWTQVRSFVEDNQNTWKDPE
ncbi:hypothetical protein C8J57DRAFT_1082411, partial [Mycena rebaudengoi]